MRVMKAYMEFTVGTQAYLSTIYFGLPLVGGGAVIMDASNTYSVPIIVLDEHRYLITIIFRVFLCRY